MRKYVTSIMSYYVYTYLCVHIFSTHDIEVKKKFIKKTSFDKKKMKNTKMIMIVPKIYSFFIRRKYDKLN